MRCVDIVEKRTFIVRCVWIMEWVSVCNFVCFLTEGGSEGLAHSLLPAGGWLDVCLGQPVCCRSQTDHLAGLPLLFILHQTGSHSDQICATGERYTKSNY